MMITRLVIRSLLCVSLGLSVAIPGMANDADSNRLAHDLLKQLVEINTTESAGSVTAAAEAMAARLRTAGFTNAQMQILGPNDRKKNLVVRLKGRGLHKPVLLIGHLDVVEARREDWTTDPFEFVEKDGSFAGRGTEDMKDGDAIMLASLIRLHEEGFKPSRDIILALTADEESGDANGIDWLIRTHRELIDAEFVINHDGFSIASEHGRPLRFEVDSTEKVYADFLISAASPGGHSSLPVPDNAIYRLTTSLNRLAQYRFPLELNAVTRGYYERIAAIEPSERANDIRAILANPPDPAAEARLSRTPADNSTLHTTCIATRIEGGHANNALPQRARATVNCRILPGHSAEEVRRTLIRVLGDDALEVQYIDDVGHVQDIASSKTGNPPPALNPQIFRPLQKTVDEMWPGLPVIPAMLVGTSDGAYTNAAGLPTYSISGIALDSDHIRAHGRDEDVSAESFYRGNVFFYRFLKALTAH